MSPRGRRPAGEDTRGAIVEAARAEFAERGYDGTSLRAVARAAGVDPALVHHYFDGKSALFAAVMDVPVDPAALIDRVVSAPRAQVGAALVATFLEVWDSEEARPRFVAVLRAAVSHEEAARMLRGFLAREVMGRVARAVDPDADAGELELRASLAAAQMVGIAMGRYVVGLPGLRDVDRDQLVARVGPVLQAYLDPPAS